MLQWLILEKRIAEAFYFLSENNIKVILIKGWSAAQFYPNPFERLAGDMDLAVSFNDYSKAVLVLEQCKNSKLIDLHKGLRHLDTVPFENLYSNSQLVKCFDTEIRVLRPEDHLRVLCVHWLTDGGAKKDRLWDIYYLLQNRPADFDWDRCLNTVSRKRRKWIVCTIGLAHKYLDLNLEDTPVAEEAKDIPGWIIECVEKEWASEVKLMPLSYFYKDGKRLWQQIKKRTPPNPIQATIDLEGEFDDGTRIFYQIGDVFLRSFLSIKRALKII